MPGKAAPNATRNNKGNNGKKGKNGNGKTKKGNNGKKGKNGNGKTKKANKPSAAEVYAASVARKAPPAPAPAPAAKTAAEQARNERNAARLAAELKKKTRVTKGSSTAAEHRELFATAMEAAAGHGPLLKKP